jgi:hypothetical protein
MPLFSVTHAPVRGELDVGRLVETRQRGHIDEAGLGRGGAGGIAGHDCVAGCEHSPRDERGEPRDRPAPLARAHFCTR